MTMWQYGNGTYMGGIANHWKEPQAKGSVQSPVPVAENSQLGWIRLRLRHHLLSE